LNLQRIGDRLRRAAPVLALLIASGLLVLAAALAYAWRERQEFMRLDDAAAHQLDLYAAVLEIELGKQADLPALIEVDGDIDAVLAAPGDAALRAALSRKLTRFAVRAGALSAAVVSAQGDVLASSERLSASAGSPLDASDKTCVADALAGREARRFAPDPQRGAPEVCFARAVVREGRTLGAVTVRISLEPIEAAWTDFAFRAESEKPLLVDERGVVILSSVPDWKLRPVEALWLPESTGPAGAALVQLRDGGAPQMRGVHTLHERPLPRYGWRVLILSSASEALRDARAAAWGAGALVACASLLAVLVQQRRRVVAQKLAARAALQRANDELERKVQERTAELVQAGKLALLGQLSAGISHELGQPLTALRALAENGRLLIERGRSAQAAENLAAITGLGERMGRITSQLKSFARKTQDTHGPARLVDAVENVRRLLSVRLRDEGVALQSDVAPDLRVHCDAYRLEQVLANLVLNALDAMRGTPGKRVAVSARMQGDRVVVSVADTGPGIPPALRERLFEPFFTTKPAGEGLGLGLVISAHIVEEFGGTLRAVEAQDGAVFEFDLGALPQESHV